VISQVIADFWSEWQRYKFFGPIRVPLTPFMQRLGFLDPVWLTVAQWISLLVATSFPALLGMELYGKWVWEILGTLMLTICVLPAFLRGRARRLLPDKLNASGGRLCTRCATVIPGAQQRAACPACSAPFEHVRDSWRWSVDLDLATMEQAEAAGVSLEADEPAGTGRSLAYRLGRAVRWVLTLGGRGGRAK
jgi:hypothetical protein